MNLSCSRDGSEFVVLGNKESLMNSSPREVFVILSILQRNQQWAAVLILTLPVFASAQNKHTEAESNRGEATAPTVTLKTFSRVVTLEVVVKDSKGHHVSGLKPGDFQISEQTPSESRAKRKQKIADFREVSMAGLAVHDPGLTAQIPAGVYTNVSSTVQNSVPLTIILVDGLNTEVWHQGRVYAQMLKMLRQLPPDVPVAVFLLGRRLFMLQDFTSDPKLLQAALSKAIITDGQHLARTDPRDDPNSTYSQLIRTHAPIPAEMLLAALRTDSDIYAADTQTRVRLTKDALVSIARYVAGYPGRKNLLWISTAFPIYLVDPTGDISRNHDYKGDIQSISAALSDARIAVYPMNPAGVLAPSRYGADQDLPLVSQTREIESQMNQGDTLRLVADRTGGIVCIGDNDLADCVHKAVADSSEFYEIAYYPDSGDWNGAYRRITVDTKLKGLHLEYRQGYFATPEGSENSTGEKDDLQRAACEGPLDATSIFLAARRLPPHPKEALKFYLMINPAALTFIATGNGGRQVNLRVGVCTFDEAGNPLHYMSKDADQKLTPSEYQLLSKGGLPHTVSLDGPRSARVRLAVMDLPSGRIGSVSVKIDSPDIVSAASSTPGQKTSQTKP